MRKAGIDLAHAPGDHDGFVVAHLAWLFALRGNSLFVFAEIAGQIGTAKFVVERRTAQRAVDHDLERAGNVLRLAAGLIAPAVPQSGYGKPRQARLGAAAPARGAFVTDFTACTRSRAGKGGDGRGMVVRFDLHQHMLLCFFRQIGHAVAGVLARHKPLHHAPLHDGGVVAVGHHGVLRRHLLGVADHAEQGFVLFLAIDDEFGIEDLVAAVFAVGLRKHHQFDVGGVALQIAKCLDQIVDFVVDQRQAPCAVGLLQRRPAPAQHVHMLHGHGVQVCKQVLGRFQRRQHAFGHAVVQQRGHRLTLRIAQCGAMQKIFGTALDAAHAGIFRQAAIAGNVGGLAGPGRHGADTRRNDDRGICHPLSAERLAIGQQLLQLLLAGNIKRLVAFNPMDETGANGAHLGCSPLYLSKQLLAAERSQGIAAFKGSKKGVQGRRRSHGDGGNEKDRIARPEQTWLALREQEKSTAIVSRQPARVPEEISCGLPGHSSC